MIPLNPDKATAILLTGTGWESITAGSLTIDTLELTPQATEAEDYGFTCIDTNGHQITGRLTTLLAVKRTTR